MVETAVDGSVEAQAMQIVADLKAGRKSVADLLGPLTGVKNMTTTINMRPGTKEQLPSADETDPSPVDSEFNKKLVSNSGPKDYVNPEPLEEYDLVAIGAGATGLLAVIMSHALGKKCALVERFLIGGDCLNVGCVPSKALIACAKKLHDVKTADQFGVVVPPGEVKIDFPKVMERMRAIRAEISEADSVQRYTRDFVEHVFLGQAKFTSKNTLEVGGKTLKFNKCMIAVGASAAIVPVPGLKDVPHLTNANFFNLEELPKTMGVIGAGPIGLELSQSMQRFGCQVTCFEASPQLLSREDPDAASLVQQSIIRDGVTVKLSARLKRVECDEGGNLYKAPFKKYRVILDKGDGEEEVVECACLLNATGRLPNVFGLGLEEAGVEYDNRRGVLIDEYFRTSTPNIYAAGDCASPYKFTHAGDWMSRLAVRNMWLGDKNKQSDLLVPWCTYTEPEVAHVGKYEAELDTMGVEYDTYKRDLAGVDRAICEGVTEGFVKISVEKGTGRILGATIVGPSAGDMISELSVCMQTGVPVEQVAGVMHPYPTMADAIRGAAAMYLKTLRTPAVNRALDVLMAEQAEADSKL